MRGCLPLVAIALAIAACGTDGNSNGNSDSVTLNIVSGDGQRQLTVELAETPEERSQGLMGREELAEDAGMLFVFSRDTTTGFWMKDTLIPLSIAFVAADGGIIDIQQMEPLSEDLHQSPQPFRYALEANRGWFERHGFTAGDRLEGLDEVDGE